EDRTLPSFGFGWAFHVGGPNSDAGSGIATDGQGNVYVTGSFNGTDVNFGPPNASPYNLSSLPGDSYDAFAAEYSPTGSLLWATRLGPSTSGEQGIAVQGSNVYVAYSPSTSGTVVKLDAGTGALGWTVSIPGSRASAVAAGQASGNVYVTGSTS